MSGAIKQLDNNTINKIAAGEVIESPKSIVKELVENSIDAKADEIIIEIKNGGKSLIRITDNGVGIKKNEIEDAFKRHYTSKISDAEDLNDLHTLGFRGEALASIAAVAKVEVITRTSDEDYGTKIVIEGGKTVLKEDIGCPIGTTFIVTDLFYNVPARLKFLKSDTSEASNINEIVVCLALCSKNVSFKYISNNSVIFKTPKSPNMLNTLSCLYDRDMVSALIEVDYESEYVKISGYTTNLTYYRGNRKYQLLFVNGRYVKHKRANFFIEAAYHTLLPKDKHPACFLKIDIATDLIDVNVHPAKTEIRLKDEEKFLDELKKSIYKALRNINLVKEIKSNNLIKNNSNSKGPKYRLPVMEQITKKPDKNTLFPFKSDTNSNYASIENSDIFSDKELELFDTNNKNTLNKKVYYNNNDEFKQTAQNIENIDNNKIFEPSTNLMVQNVCENKINDNQNYYTAIQQTNNDLQNDTQNEQLNINISAQNIDNINEIKVIEYNDEDFSDIDKINELDNDSDDLHLNKLDKTVISELTFIGMLFNTYILCESTSTNEFYMIDQHAAHERINYEKYLAQIESRNIVLQELLIPEVINLSYEDYYLATNNKDFFEKIGLPIESFGINDILINSVPMIFIDVNIKNLFFTILDSIKELKKIDNLDIELKKVIKNACVQSVKAGDSLHTLEIKKLIEDLSNTKSPYTCPHGRPTIIKMSKYEVERMFERIQN